MSNNEREQTNTNQKFTIYPDDVTVSLRAPSNTKPKEIPYIQPIVSEIRQSLEQSSIVISKNIYQTFGKFNSYWLQGRVYLYNENFQLGAIGVSSFLGTLLLVRKRKPIWRFSLPIIVGVSLTGYAYLRKEWNNFDLYNNIIALQKGTPLPPGKDQAAFSKQKESNSEILNIPERNSNSENT